MSQFVKLLRIEGKLTLRCPDSIFFGICMPMGIMLLIGMIAGNKPAFDGAEYTFLQSSFAALSSVGICAVSFMGVPLNIADYRDKKILKHFFVTPITPLMLLLIQVIMGVVIAITSLVLVAAVAIFGFHYQMKGSFILFIGAYLLVMIAMLSIGMMLASICKSIKVANVVCSIVYFPMLFLSGATIPYELFPKALQKVANILPLTQGIKLMKGFSLGIPVESLVPSILVLLVTSVIAIGVSLATFRWE